MTESSEQNILYNDLYKIHRHTKNCIYFVQHGNYYLLIKTRNVFKKGRRRDLEGDYFSMVGKSIPSGSD